MSLPDRLDLAALLDALGFTDEEFVSISHDNNNTFRTAVMPPADAMKHVAALPRKGPGVYFGVNPTRGPKRRHDGRGKAEDVTRLAALYADLDIKSGGCPDAASAEVIIADLSSILGTRPVAVTDSGFGFHPYWAIADGTADTAKLAALLKRWGRLVKSVAQKHGAQVDSVFDLPRVLRVPDTHNRKRHNTNGKYPRVRTCADSGAPLTVDEVDERLSEVGISAEEGDEQPTEDESSGTDWHFAAETCDYVRRVIDGYHDDKPNGRGSRHNWMLSQSVRLMAARRLGCISKTDYRSATTTLKQRFTELRATTGETPGRYEVAAALVWAKDKVARMADAAVRAELGNHEHRQAKVTDLAADSHESPDGADEFDEDETPKLATSLLTRTDLLALPDPEPLIDNVLDQGTTALLYGKWGTLKTFIALDWAASVATGRPWQGRTTVMRRVLYIVGEGAWGFKGRVHSWETGWQRTISDESLSVLPMPVNLLKTAEVAELAALIRWGGYGFIILDTLARCMVGGEENSAKDSGIVVDAMTRLRDATPGGRGVVLGAHHAGKDTKTLRGSSAFEAGVDTVYFTSRDEQAVTLNREKRKDGPETDVHMLEFDAIPGTSSGTLRMSHGMSHERETGERTATLRSIMSQHFSLTGASAAELRRLAVDDGPLTRPTFYRALSDLLESKWLTNTGTEKRPHYRIA